MILYVIFLSEGHNEGVSMCASDRNSIEMSRIRVACSLKTSQERVLTSRHSTIWSLSPPQTKFNAFNIRT